MTKLKDEKLKDESSNDRASVRAVLSEAFEQLGGVNAMVEWARNKPTEFFNLYAKLLPLEVKSHLSGAEGGPIRLEPVDRPPRETREQWLERKRREAEAADVVPPARPPT